MSQIDTVDAQVVPETQALAVSQPSGAVGILRPAGSLDAIAEAFKEYQQVCERILTKDDYQLYDKKPRKKKSAWRKLATAFNVSTSRISEDIQRKDGQVVSARFCIRAYTPTRQMEAEGYCEIHEKCCASSRGEKCHKTGWKGHYCCSQNCDGRKHWSHPEHDIIATAQTRATNRAIADLIGCGEVSAEELCDEIPDHGHTPAPAPAPSPAPTPPTHHDPPKTSNGHTLHAPTVATRKWMVDTLVVAGLFKEPGCREYFQKVEGRELLMPNESVADLPLPYVPNSHDEMRMLITRIKAFLNGERAERAFEPHLDAEVKGKPAKPAADFIPTGPVKDPLWWRDVIVSIPRKGQKRDEYLKNPDTLGSLFDARHNEDEESRYMRQRLWGLEKGARESNWIPQPKEFNGKIYPPSDGDKKLYEALKAFSEWFSDNHRGEKL